MVEVLAQVDEATFPVFACSQFYEVREMECSPHLVPCLGTWLASRTEPWGTNIKFLPILPKITSPFTPTIRQVSLVVPSFRSGTIILLRVTDLGASTALMASVEESSVMAFSTASGRSSSREVNDSLQYSRPSGVGGRRLHTRSLSTRENWGEGAGDSLISGYRVC